MQGESRHDKSRHGMGRQGKEMQCKGNQGYTWKEKAWNIKV
jgi:hypothetical protein